MVPAKRKVIANLKVKDFSDDFELLYHNGIKIKLPRALSQDIKRELEKISREICEENLFLNCFVVVNIQRMCLIHHFIMH